MSTLPSDATPKTDQQGQEEANPSKKVHKAIKKEVETCKQYRRKLVANWIVSIDYRRGKPFSSQTDEDRIAVNLDWALTKAKHASCSHKSRLSGYLTHHKHLLLLGSMASRPN
jgi:hypothetical protein